MDRQDWQAERINRRRKREEKKKRRRTREMPGARSRSGASQREAVKVRYTQER